MKIKYLGPSKSVIVAPHGTHKKDETKDYPDEFAEDLLVTSKKQKFEAVDGVICETGALEDMTVAALKELLGKLDVSYDSKATKAELIKLIESSTAESAKKD